MNVTELPWQKGLADAEIVTLTGKFGLTVIVTVLLVAGFPVGQIIFDVRRQVTTSPLLGKNEYAGRSVPTIIPFTFHSNDGAEPPFVGLARNVTDVPVQIGFADGEMVTLTGFNGLTTICIELDVEGLFEMQTVSDEVRTQVIRSPDTGL